MDMLKRCNARLAGIRLYLLAIVFALPDVLSALVGFDWTPLLLVPVLKNARDAARGPRPGFGPEEGPR